MRKRRRFRSPPPPPTDGPGGGDGGDGGGGDLPWPPENSPPEGTYRFALWLAIAGISTFFSVFFALWILQWRGSPPPANEPGIPSALWVSTVVLLASSSTISMASRRIQASSPDASSVVRWLLASVLLGVVFLVSQVVLWRSLIESGNVPASGSYMSIFFALTGLHALHVAGGLLTMIRTTLRVRSDVNPSTRSESIRLCATYWHFMGVVWVAVFGTLTVLR